MPEDCKKILDYSLFDLIKLTGITSLIPIRRFYKKHPNLVPQDSYTCMMVFDNDFLTMRVVINSKDKTINILEFSSKGKTKRVFLKVLYSMQYHGTRMNFNHIELVAMKNQHTTQQKNTIAYVVAGKYGFLMADDDKKHLLKKTAINAGLPHCEDIYTLLLNEKGLKDWINKGKQWHGIFPLNIGSTSVRLIEHALSIRGLKGQDGMILSR